MKLGNKIRVIRLINGYSQEYVSIQLGISQTTYSRIENKNSKITIFMLTKICLILNVSMISLLECDEISIEKIINDRSKKSNKDQD